MRRTGRGTALAVSLLAGLALGASAQEIVWTGSLELARGDYVFSEPTTSFWFSNGVDVRMGVIRIGASLPLVLQNNAVVARVGGIPLPTGGERHGELGGRGGNGSDGSNNGPGGQGGTSGSIAGLAAAEVEDPVVIEPGSYEIEVADPLLTVGTDLRIESGPLRSVFLGASAKPPLRSVESGVGTGAWDAGVGAGVVISIADLLVLVDATYWSYGDLPELELKDALSYGASIGALIGDGPVGWSVSLLGSMEIVAGLEPPVSVGADILISPARGPALRAGVRAGLTESASNVSASVGWSVPLRRGS